MMTAGTERKAIVGRPYRFWWEAVDGWPDEAPDVVLRFAAGTATVTLAPVRAPDTVTAVSADRRQVTLAPTFVAATGDISYHGAPAEGETLTIPDGVTPVTFTFTADPGLDDELIDLNGNWDAIVNAINLHPTLAIAATNDGPDGPDEIALVNTANNGPAGNVAITDTVAAAGFTVSGMSGGAGLATAGVVGDYGSAWLDAGASFQGPVRVLRLISEAAGVAIVELAEPLPHPVAIVGAAYLRWTVYSAEVPVADAPDPGVPAAPERNVLWTVDWDRHPGGDLPTDAATDRGLLHVVRAAFATGIEDDDVYALVPAMAGYVPRRQGSWEAEREAALQRIVPRIRAARAPYNEDAWDGAQFARAHALFTAIVVIEGQQAAGYDRREALLALNAQADAALADAIAHPVWIDLDGDGVVDAGETDLSPSGPSAAWVGGFFGGGDPDFDATAFPAFTRGQRH